MFNWKRKPKRSAPANGYEVAVSIVTDVGCCRDTNEDNGRYIKPGDPVVLAARGVLAVVADGMGGHSAGEVASKIAVEVVADAYYKNEGDAQESLKNALVQANHEIYQASLKEEKLRGMGTTCTAVALQDGCAVAAHVGDSRLYLIRDDDIYLMTEDHSAVMEMVRHGLITFEEARSHADKNVILRALGTNPEVEVSTWDEPFPVKAGDSLLLCSDGLYDLVQDAEIKHAVTGGDIHAACSELIALARQRGGFDNITVAIINIRPKGLPQPPPPETREAEAVQP